LKKGLIYVDIKKCLACKSCEIACAVQHSKSKNLREAIKEKPLPRSRIKVRGTSEMSIPLQCRQCEEAPCVRICPTKAMIKSIDGIININHDLCIGCKWCVFVCPFGVIRMDNDNRMIIKCNLCIERLEKGEFPACVVSCPTKALKFESIDDVASEKQENFLVEFKK